VGIIATYDRTNKAKESLGIQKYKEGEMQSRNKSKISGYVSRVSGNQYTDKSCGVFRTPQERNSPELESSIIREDLE